MRAIRQLTIVLAVFAGLVTAPPARAEELVIPGSGNPEFVLAQLAAAFNAAQKQHRVVVPDSTGTAGAIRDLREGKTSVGRVGRPLKEAERNRGLNYFAIGKDAVVFVAGSGVTARGLTRQQAYEIYSGKLTDWQELGAKPGPIRVIGREDTDASRQVINREILPFALLKFPPHVKVVNLDPQMLALLDRYPTSQGFLNRSALAAAKTKLNLLALDAVEPTPENLENGRYPLWLEFGLAYMTGALSSAGAEFMAFIDSAEGVRILRQHGVLPVRDRRHRP